MSQYLVLRFQQVFVFSSSFACLRPRSSFEKFQYLRRWKQAFLGQWCSSRRMGNSCRRRQQEPPAVVSGFGYRQGGAISRAAAIKSIKAEKKSVSVQTEPAGALVVRPTPAAGALVVRPTPRGTDRLEYESQIAELVRAGREDLEEFARTGWLEPRRTDSSTSPRSPTWSELGWTQEAREEALGDFARSVWLDLQQCD